jgi:hypothetical protein
LPPAPNRYDFYFKIKVGQPQPEPVSPGYLPRSLLTPKGPAAPNRSGSEKRKIKKEKEKKRKITLHLMFMTFQ